MPFVRAYTMTDDWDGPRRRIAYVSGRMHPPLERVTRSPVLEVVWTAE